MEKEKQYRAFFAIEIPAELRRNIQLIISALNKLPKFRDIKWIKEDNLHITLRFLGSITPEQLESIVADVNKVLDKLTVFAVKLVALKLFPSPGQPHVLALAPQSYTDLVSLYQTLDKIVSKYRVHIDKHSFVPHLTLARLRGIKITELPELKIPTLKFKVTELQLFRSEPSVKGTVYTPLASFQLS